MERKKVMLPNPIIDKKEEKNIDLLTERYNRLTEPSTIAKIGTKATELIPKEIKGWAKELGTAVTEQKIYTQMMEIVADGFKTIEEYAAKYSINEKDIIAKMNEISNQHNISSIEEICLIRSYDISKLVSRYKGKDIIVAFIEGGGTGVAGFWGLPFNIVLSTFLYFRAVQSIALYYGYDIKNDDSELVIASEVFMNALSPMNNDLNNEMTSIIGKIMLMSQAEVVKQTAKRTWTIMAQRGGVPLLITQMRALASKSAQKALQNAGAKGLENSIFRDILEQIGRKLSLKTTSKAVPYVSGVLGALIDTAQMRTVLDYADVFYHKRFLLEKESRINDLIGNTVIDAEIINEENN